MRRSSFIGSALLLTFSSFAFAAEDSASNNLWNFGPAISTQQSLFVGGESDVSFSVVRVRDTAFLSRGPLLPFRKTGTHQFYIGGSLSDWDHNRGDSPALAGMSDLDLGVDLRLGSAWRGNKGVTELQFLQDVTAHKGAQARLRYTHMPKTDKVRLLPYAELQWLSSDLTDYYVGVNTNEVIAGRPQYDAGYDYGVKTGVDVEYPLSKRLTVVGGVQLIHYGDEISESPIVDRSTLWGGNVGLSYRWK